jgi:FKBP-type peptidyl-prolyl cis-trans isomerase (trigger factor)
MKFIKMLVRSSFVLIMLIMVTCSKNDRVGSKFRKVNFADSTVIAMVNGQAIFNHEVDFAVRQFLLKMGKDPNFFVNQQKDTSIYNQALNWLISIRLLAQEADKNKIKVEQSEIDASMNSFKRTFSSEQKFQDFLTQNHLTRETFISDLTDELKVQKLLDQKVTAQVVEITDQEALQYYNDNGEKYPRAPYFVQSNRPQG